MYKDKDRQKEANRQAQARFKAKGITEQGITQVLPVIPDAVEHKRGGLVKYLNPQGPGRSEYHSKPPHIL